MPILLLNGAIYAQRYDPGNLPASFRVDGYPADVVALYILQCKEPIRATWPGEIAAIGGQVRGYLPYNSLLVELDGQAHSRLGELGFVEWSTLYQPYFKLAPAVQLRLLQGGQIEILAQLSSNRFLADTVSSLSKAGMEVLGSEGDAWGAVVKIRLPSEKVRDVAALPAVEWVEVSGDGSLCGAIEPGETGVSYVRHAAADPSDGEKIAVTDTGIGSGGMAGIPLLLRSNVASLDSGRADNGADPDGHGTAVAGVLAGVQDLYENSARTRNSIMEYAAGYGLSGGPLSLYSMLDNAYAGGARIHLSGTVPEGSESAGAYGIYASQRDAFVWNNPDMMLIEPAGNQGTDGDRDGIVDKGNLLGGATSKDAVSVGGSESTKRRSDGGDIPTYGGLQGLFGGIFPVAPIKDDPCVGDQPGMAAFSSRGPASDGRIKPDLVAPATYILSAAAANPTAPGIRNWEPGYVRAYGTSMAAAEVAREAADLQAELARKRSSQPSAALLKAFLLNGAAEMAPGQYGTGQAQEIAAAPNGVEGWGLLDAEASANESSWIKVLDDTEGLRSGESRVFKVEVGGAKTLRVTLAWSDYPALPEARLQLVNDLDLKITDNDGNVVYPNGRSSRDPLNNAERIALDVSGKPGIYTIEISGWNVPFSPQPFALVAQLY